MLVDITNFYDLYDDYSICIKHLLNPVTFQKGRKQVITVHKLTF